MSRKDNHAEVYARRREWHRRTATLPPHRAVGDLYVFGSLDANSALYNFLGQEGIAVHFFNYYEHYTGSFMPREYLLAGKMQVEQTKHYMAPKKRIDVARKFVQGAGDNILRVLKYYDNRDKDKALTEAITTVNRLMASIPATTDVPMLMGIEGNIRQTYYGCFDAIVGATFTMDGRSKRPPKTS